MNASSNLSEKLTRSKGYRESFVASVVKRMIPLQIRVLRKQREWSQARLADESKLTQGVISRAEDPNYGNLTVNTLVRIASGFDCAFVGRFVPFSELGRWYATVNNEKTLEVPSFKDDTGFDERKPVASEMRYATAQTVAAAGGIALGTRSTGGEGKVHVQKSDNLISFSRQAIVQESIYAKR